MATEPMTETPKIPGWQLVIRFSLEIAAQIALGLWGYRVWGWPLAIALPVIAAGLWGTFAVVGDPSRSGKAVVAVPGAVRLAIELLVFLAGAAALAALEKWWPLGLYVAALALHHAQTVPRVRWLLSR
ncbi:MAG: hypothetical protein H6Q89_1473 [Myxococcaceae bacterium]|nr:hypothetical protein [Myxococcaceae bacterium]